MRDTKMKFSKTMLLVSSFLMITVFPAISQADEQKYALRFGGVIVDPTSSATIRGENAELDTAVGGELNFEWYFSPAWGLDISSIGAVDVEDIEDDYAIGMSISPFTVGINYHPVRTSTVDWSVGAILGAVSYGDFVVDGDNINANTKRDFAYGLQTSVDLTPASWQHWGFNLGAKYLKSSVELEGSPIEVRVDPLIWRAMLIYKW